MQHEELIIKEVPQDDSTSLEEKMVLYNEIKKLKPKVVVETGTHRGLTSLYLLHALWENGEGHLHTADPYEWGAKGNFRKFPELEKHVTWYQLRGSEMISELNDIDFAFIDGFHEKVEVLEEMNALLPRLAENAVVYLHDTNGSNEFCDVPGALKELGLKVEYLKTQNGMAKYVHKRTNTNDKATVSKTNRKSPRKTDKPKVRVASRKRKAK